MRNARRGAALLLFLALSPVWAAEKVPAVVTKEAEGEAAVVGSNVDRAVREAKEAALRSAVERVAGVLVSSQSLAVNSQLVSTRCTRTAPATSEPRRSLADHREGRGEGEDPLRWARGWIAISRRCRPW
jgi:hypothetical protein